MRAGAPGSSDFGDVTCVMPGVTVLCCRRIGTGHGIDYYVKDPNRMCVNAVKAQLFVADALLGTTPLPPGRSLLITSRSTVIRPTDAINERSWIRTLFSTMSTAMPLWTSRTDRSVISSIKRTGIPLSGDTRSFMLPGRDYSASVPDPDCDSVWDSDWDSVCELADAPSRGFSTGGIL